GLVAQAPLERQPRVKTPRVLEEGGHVRAVLGLGAEVGRPAGARRISEQEVPVRVARDRAVESQLPESLRGRVQAVRLVVLEVEARLERVVAARESERVGELVD